MSETVLSASLGEDDELYAALGLSEDFEDAGNKANNGSLSAPRSCGSPIPHSYQRSLLMLAAEDSRVHRMRGVETPEAEQKELSSPKQSGASPIASAAVPLTVSFESLNGKCSGGLASKQSSLDGPASLDDGQTTVDSDDFDDCSLADRSSLQSERLGQSSLMQSLSKEPVQRTVEDLNTILDFVQHWAAFTNMTIKTKERLCAVVELQTVRDPMTVVVRSGDEPAYWWVVFGGSVEELLEDQEQRVYLLGECFGVTQGQKNVVQQYSIVSAQRDTMLLRIAADLFHEIIWQSESETVKVVQNGEVVLVTEPRKLRNLYGHVVVRGRLDQLVSQLVSDDNADPAYIEDFLLGHRTFSNGSGVVALLSEHLHGSGKVPQRAAHIVLLWASLYPDDFARDAEMDSLLASFHDKLVCARLKNESKLIMHVYQGNAILKLTIPPSTNKKEVSSGWKKTLVDDAAEILDSFIDPLPEKREGSIKRSSGRRISFGSKMQQSLVKTRGKSQLSSKMPSSLKPLLLLNSSLADACIEVNSNALSEVPAGVQLKSSQSSIANFVEEVQTTVKLYRQDHSFKYVLVGNDMTAEQLVQLGLRQFDIGEKAQTVYSLCRVTVTPEGIVKQTRLPDQMTKLPSLLSATSRFYLKKDDMTANLVHGILVQEILQEGATNLLSLETAEVVRTVTLRDFNLFKSITPTEYLEHLWDVKPRRGGDHLEQFSKTTNDEMFWVVTEILREESLPQRVRLIKYFVKMVKLCREIRNFNTMFAITSGLTYGALSRLKTTWEKVSNRYIREIEDVQKLMDPSRNMYNYRAMVSSAQTPLVPFFPVVTKDLTFMYLGNDNKVEGLINFDKVRMVTNEVQHFCSYHKLPYDPVTMMGDTREKVDSKRAHEQWFLSQRINQYFSNFKAITDEAVLKEMAVKLELMSKGAE